MDLRQLRNRVRGDVTTPADAGYESLRRSMVWNRLAPEQRPGAIVQAASEQDVVEAVRFARAARLKIALRGGGHSWVGFSLRDGTLLIDLGRLNSVSIDRDSQRAVIQPAVRGRELNRSLAAQGLAFPVGHCPTVPMSGFILNGALGWNFNEWGPGCFSVEAARVVTAAGDVVIASTEANPDLLWAIRGGGPGFFGVVTEYTLRLYPRPKAITTSSYYYPLEHVEEVGAWAGGAARNLPKRVELTIFVAAAPPPIADRCASQRGRACVVSGTAFAESAGEAASMLRPLDSCPAANACMLEERNLSTPIDALHDMGAMLWPEGHRYLADTLWTNSPPGEVLAASRDCLGSAPSSKSFGVLVLSTGERAPLPDGAYSMAGDALALCYAVWERPEDDTANAAWHRATIVVLDRYAVGHYVGESDIAADPRRAERSYAWPNWERLQALRLKFDPDGLFVGHFAPSQPDAGRR